MSLPVTPTDRTEQAAAIRHEAWQLAALVVLAIVAFFVTRSVAASNREMSLRDAAEWYRRGQAALAERRVDDAVDDFRRATVRNRTDRPYVLALAHALALKHDDEAARAALLSVREASPEDPEINLELARLAAGRDDVTEASRFYHNALYAPWAVESSEERRSVRLELVQFLLTHHQQNRAVSELLAMASDLPDDVPHHVQVAQLFARAGDAANALRQFEDALRLDADDSAALAGAGQAAFALADYARARRYLQRALKNRPENGTTLEITELVLSRDPLANRIGYVERRRRLVADISYASERLTACLAAGNGQTATADADLQGELQAFNEALTTPPLEQDTVESGIDLIERVEQRVVARCGPATAMDQALLLVAREHAGVQ